MRISKLYILYFSISVTGSDGLESFKNKGQTYCDTVPLKGQFTRKYSTVQLQKCQNNGKVSSFGQKFMELTAEKGELEKVFN